MLTIIEKIRQKYLELKEAPLYELNIKNSDDEDNVLVIRLFAQNDEEAELLAARIRLRLNQQNKLRNQGKLQAFGLNPKELIVENKWGVINPVKDPAYKRSWESGTKLPLLQSKAMFSIAMKSATKGSVIHKDDLTIEDITSHQTKCFIAQASAVFIFMCGIVVIIKGIIANTGLFSSYNYGASLAIIYGCFTFAHATHKKHRLKKWKGELNE